MSQWHDHFAQIQLLCFLPINDIVGAKSVSKFIPVLVTNGEIEEDVQAAIGMFNRSTLRRRSMALPLRVWNRGAILELLRDGAEAVWPHSPRSQIALLRAIVRDYRDEADISEYEALFDEIVGREWKRKSASNSRSLMILLFLATNMYCSKYVSEGNYYESLRVKSFFYARLCAYAEARTDNSTRMLLLSIRESIISELVQYVNFISEEYKGVPLNNDDYVSEFTVYHVRKLLIQSLCAVCALEDESRISEDAVSRALESLNYPGFTHEGVVPAFLAIFWAKELKQGARLNEAEIVALLRAIIQLSEIGQLRSPYESVDDVVQWRYKAFLGESFSSLDFETAKHMSFSSLALFYLLAKRNWKKTCKLVWPQLTEVVNVDFQVSSARGFSSWRTEDGINRNYFVRYPVSWDEMIKDMPRKRPVCIPDMLVNDMPMLILFLIFYPFRMTTEIAIHIDDTITETWY